MFRRQRLEATKIAVARSSAHLDCESDQPVGEQAAGVHEEIHHVRVIGVFHPAQARLDHGKTCLHEHDEKAAYECPNEVDGDLVLPNLVSNIGNRNASLWVCCGDVIDGSSKGTSRISLGQICRSGSLACGILQLGVCRGSCDWSRCGSGSRRCRCRLGVRQNAQSQGKGKNTKSETTISKDFFHRECSIVVLAAVIPVRCDADSPFQNALLLKVAGKM